MCVPLVTDETIEQGELIVDSEGPMIKITINDSEGRLVSENNWGWQSGGGYPQTVSFYRVFRKGQLWEHDLKLEWKEDYSSMAGPTIVATGVGNLTKYEVAALLNVVTHGDYEASEIKTNKWGIIESITFKDKPLIVEEDSYRPMELVEL